MPKSKFGRENPDAIDTPDENEFIYPHDFATVQERGFWGTAATDEDKSQYTVDGVTSRPSTLRSGVETDGIDTSQSPESVGGGGSPRGRRARHETTDSTTAQEG
jgi:hypothetical protein